MDEASSTTPPRGPNAPAALPAAAPAPVAVGLGLLWPLVWVLLLTAALVASVVGSGRWLLLSEDGTRWMLARLPNIEARGVKGTLLGEMLEIESLRVQWAGGTKWLQAEGLRAQGLRWQWSPERQLWVKLDAQQLSVRRIEVHTGPASPPPKDLLLPLHMTLRDAQIDTLSIDAQTVTDLKLRGLLFDGRPGQQHVAEHFEFSRDGNRVQGNAQMSASAPLTLQAQASLVPGAARGAPPPWAAALSATGALERLAVRATLRSVPRAGLATPSLDLTAEVLPYAPWPLAALSARTEALDLAALTNQAPQTRLSGSAEIFSSAIDAPISARIRLTNSRPGRWDAGRLPLRGIDFDLRGQLQRRDQLDLTRFELLMADERGDTGRWSGSGHWHGSTLELDSQLVQLATQRLDSRATAVTLSGPLKLQLLGLPSPDPAAPVARTAWQLRWQSQAEGQLAATTQTVRLESEGQASAKKIEIHRLLAQSGGAKAELQGTLERQAQGIWRVQSTGQLKDFDPRPWWPGAAGSAWRQGPHVFSAHWSFDLHAPETAAQLEPLALVQSLAGNGLLRVHDSVLAGVPLSAEVRLEHKQGALPHPGSLVAQLQLDGNEIVIEGRGDPAGNGQNDRWRTEIKADKLAALAPLAALHPALAPWAARRGKLSATLTADGRWPQLRTEGQAQLQQLQAGDLSISTGQAQWQFDPRSGRPVQLQLSLGGAQSGTQRAEQLSATLRGTLAEHRIELSADLPMALPALARQALALPLQPGSRAQLLAQGRWLSEAGGGWRWRADIERLSVGGWDGKSPNAAPTQPWADARQMRAELLVDAQGRLAWIEAQPGQIRLGDVLTMRWDAVRIDLLGARPQLELRADIEPFLAAPLLARLQPNVGWGGDLRLAARIDVKALQRFDADVVFERKDGDLHIKGAEGAQLLGLSELRLGLAAHDGQWRFSPAFRGRSLGEIRGEVRVRSSAEQRWPAPDAPVEGSVQARVADIGIWSNWVPAGWRLAGEVSTMAQIGGSFGDPKFTGQASGKGLAVRNLLQGVNVTDGQVSLRLEGDAARIDHFTLKAGEGRISITGGASLGRNPSAKLNLVAERFRVLGRIDRQLIASGQAELALQRDQLKLDGKFRVDEALFDASRADAPSLDDDVTVRKPGEPGWSPTEEATPGPRRNIQVGIDIDLGEKTHVKGRGLDTILRGKVRLTTPGGRPALTGSIYTDQGTYQAYGQRLEIERGVVTFIGPLDTPRLDVLALRPNIDTRVGVSISGNLQLPRVRLYSQPEVSDTEKLSWLVLGRAPDGLGRADTALLQRAAVALLAGEGEAPTDALLRKLGIDEVSLRQGEGDVRETVISLGKQISRRWYVGYERGVNSTAGTWQLIYRVAQRFTLRAQSGIENSVDIIWVKPLNEADDNVVRKSIAIPP